MQDSSRLLPSNILIVRVYEPCMYIELFVKLDKTRKITFFFNIVQLNIREMKQELATNCGASRHMKSIERFLFFFFFIVNCSFLDKIVSLLRTNRELRLAKTANKNEQIYDLLHHRQ